MSSIWLNCCFFPTVATVAATLISRQISQQALRVKKEIGVIYGATLNKPTYFADRDNDESRGNENIKHDTDFESIIGKVDWNKLDAASFEAQIDNAQDYREECDKIQDEAKSFLKEKEKLDQRGSYSEITWNNPRKKAELLHERKQISKAQLDSALRLFAIWYRYGKGVAVHKIVPKEVFEEMERQLDVLRSDAR